MSINTNIDNYLRESKHSETLLINQLSLTRAEQQQKVFKFGFGQSPFPVPESITQALAKSAHRKEYMPVQGYLPLRQAICDFHQHQEQKNWQADNIIVGAGSKILLFCVMAAFEQAEIVLPAPSWVSYEPQGKIAGHKVTWITTNFKDKWHLTPEQLEIFCQTREKPEIPLILVFNYPSNPTGQSYSKDQLLALANIMRKYNVIVIADEIYSLLSYKKHYATLDEFYPEGCMVSSGLSKWCGAGGWRLGFMHIPAQLNKLLKTVIGVASETYSCASSPIQVAATHAYLDNKLADKFLSDQINFLNEISQYCTRELKKIGVNVHAAEGGFYLFPEFSRFTNKLQSRGIKTSEELTTALMNETGVALLPGSAFGMPKHSLTTRLAFVDFDGGQVFIKTDNDYNFDKVKEGIKQLCLWLLAL